MVSSALSVSYLTVTLMTADLIQLSLLRRDIVSTPQSWCVKKLGSLLILVTMTRRRRKVDTAMNKVCNVCDVSCIKDTCEKEGDAGRSLACFTDM
jgi:hypothetical protein